MKLKTRRYYGQTGNILDAVVRFAVDGTALGIERFAGQMPLFEAQIAANGSVLSMQIVYQPLERRHFIEAAKYPALYSIELEEGETLEEVPLEEVPTATADNDKGDETSNVETSNKEPIEYSINQLQPGLADSGKLDIAAIEITAAAAPAPETSTIETSTIEPIAVEPIAAESVAIEPLLAPNALTVVQDLHSMEPVEVEGSKAVIDAPIADAPAETAASLSAASPNTASLSHVPTTPAD